MDTLKQTITKTKTHPYEVSTPNGEVFKTTNKVLAQEQARKLKSELAIAIHFVDHKQKEHWYYERTPNQNNYRKFQVTYEAPKISNETQDFENVS